MNTRTAAPPPPSPAEAPSGPKLDVGSIRRSHIKRLVGREGSIKAFAEKVETDPNYISAILSPEIKRNAGGELMRRIEKKFGLNQGALDQPDEEAAAAAMALQLLPDAARESIYEQIEFQAERTGALYANQELSQYLSVIRTRSRRTRN